MPEIGLPTSAQVQSVLDNQLNSMEFHSISASVLSEQIPEPLLEVTGAGILLFISKSMDDSVVTSFYFTIDNADTVSSDVLIGGSHGSNVTLMIPFNQSLIVKGSRNGDANTVVGINYLLK